MRPPFSCAFLLLILFCCSFRQPEKAEAVPTPGAVIVKWVDTLSGDFSFTKEWSYPHGVEMKSDGKAGYADGGFAPERCSGMLGKNGIVLKDSATLFYQLLDTTHRFHTISCEAKCYEWDGTDFIQVKRDNNSVAASTETGVSTHCSLNLVIKGDTCYAFVLMNSIIRSNNTPAYAKSGHILIDRTAWNAGILKAEFDLDFDNKKHPDEPIYFRGMICSPIESQ